MKVSVYIATSLDGFIARQDGSLDWLPGAEEQPESGAEDYGYQSFIESVDALVMGRITFETVLSFGSWPYGEKPVFVLSTTLESLPKNLPHNLKLKSGSVTEIYIDLKTAGFQHIYLDGGATIQKFLHAGLVDELIITIIPVLIGDGISLFGRLTKDVTLELLQCRRFDSGFVQNHYKIVK
jgi:dihydrofolate reductase